MLGVGPNAAPQKLESALRPIGREHAGAAELEEPLAAVPRHERRDAVFQRAVEAVRRLGTILPQQTICADDFRFRLAEATDRRMIDDEQMIAGSIEGTNIAPDQRGGAIGSRAAFFVKHLVAQALRL